MSHPPPFAFLMSGWLAAITAWSAAAETVDYVREIKPVLKSRCYSCHGALKQEAGLRLDSGEGIRRGGESGTAILPGNADGSGLIERITASDIALRMPPEGEPLKPDQIARIRTWISQGASSPKDEQPEQDPGQHWSFQPPVRPALPMVANGDSLDNPIDAFLSRELARLGLPAQPPAEKSVLLRRAHLDLIGLPPTRDELHAFLADESPEAYQRVLDRLLDSPQYGERWARHWMDIWRYSDWYGRRSVPDVMYSYPRIWRWRDWIVRSLNSDKGYDRMVVEMLAADEVAPADTENVVATGFIVRNWFKWNYDSWMRDQVEHTGKAFLGLWFQCSLCHDHKYDPISQHEYFKMRAFFEPLELRHDRVAGEPDPGPFQKYIYGKPYGPIGSGLIRVFDEKLDAKTLVYRGGDQRNVVKDLPPMPPGVPKFLGGDSLRIEPVTLPVEAWYPGLRRSVQQEQLAKRQATRSAAEAELAAARTTRDQQIPARQALVQQADAALAAAVQAESKQRPVDSAAISGLQSLLLNATTGRRVFKNSLPGVPEIPAGASARFSVRLLKDAHFNLQFALDVTMGATGGWVGFEKGKILTYQPGGFQQIEAGTYDLAMKQPTFTVTCRLNVEQNQFLLTVENVQDQKKIVDSFPAALNGWRGLRDGRQGLFLDARPGTMVLLDDLVFQSSDGAPWLVADFEPPKYTVGRDVAGIDGWEVHSSSLAPATSSAVRYLESSPAVSTAEQQLVIARRAAEALDLAVKVADAKVASADADLRAFEARIAAETAKHISHAADADRLARLAADAERRAAHHASLVAVAAGELAVATAEAITLSDAKRLESIQKAEASLATARAAAAEKEASLAKTDAVYSPLSEFYPQQSTGRRTALANWIVDRKNPLAARVAVNHIWNWHFGRPLVDTVSNFGRNGKAPSHPELLDWLAVEFMEHGWSQKHLHRLIMTSAAYCRSSHATSEHPGTRLDPDNRFLWRAHVTRLEAESVRDSLLHVAGQLDQTIGGTELEQSLGLSSRRRSLYFSHHGEARMQFLELFDAASTLDCYRRTTSILPQQALALSNSELTRQQARNLAALLDQEFVASPTASDADRSFVIAAFEQTLSRSPTADEVQLSLAFLDRQRSLYAEKDETQSNAAGPPVGSTQVSGAAPPAVPGAPPRPANPVLRSRESLVHALLNHNDFLTVR